MLFNHYRLTAAGRSPGVMSLFWWEGWSGAWYLTSVCDLKGFSCPEAGVFMVVRREAWGQCTPLLIGSAKSISDELYQHHGDALLRAIKAGATEIHVHLASETAEQREIVMEDIADGWRMPSEKSLQPV